MVLARLFQTVRGLVQRPNKKFSDLHSPDEVKRVLHRERVRAERSGEPFSMIVFTPREPQPNSEVVKRLIEILKKRVRLTDDIGWLDPERISVILPSTPPPGAWKVADDVVLEFPQSISPPLPTVYTFPFHWDRHEDVEEMPALNQSHPTLPLEALFVLSPPTLKRVIDILGSSFGLLVLLPLFVVVGALIKLTSRGPIFFTQLRSGRGGKPFNIYKFRTMVSNAEQLKAKLMEMNEQDGPAFKIKKDPRITWIGGVLRSTSLDELPQLWNVLRGEMSLVGPRPLPCHEADACALWQRQRLNVTPGLTCIWQVRGRSRVSFDDWVRMDVQYIRSQSFWKDLLLILQTVPAVLLRKGAH